MIDRLLFRQIYRQAAGRAEKLPWHREEPPVFLVDAAAARAVPGRALDLGCGSGVDSTWLAERGHRVTAVDFTPAAVELTRDRARAAGVDLDVREIDALELVAPEPFDLVLDSGCLHIMNDAQRARYRERLLSWLAPGGDFVLLHLGIRDPRDRHVIPRRWTRERTVDFFAPELREHAYREDDHSAPLPVGPRVRMGQYWFVRSGR